MASGEMLGFASSAQPTGLLDALTGRSVAGAAGLSGTDSLLNIQANGTAYAASTVLVKGRPIGNGNLLSLTNPVRITVDLSGVADGTTLKLYFDLLGLGAKNSRVRIDDVQLLTSLNTEPVAVDDQVTTAEDVPVVIPALANDVDAEGDTLAVSLIAGPQHGTLAQNADGRFRYTPEANFYGADFFTYIDGQWREHDHASVLCPRQRRIRGGDHAGHIRCRTDVGR